MKGSLGAPANIPRLRDLILIQLVRGLNKDQPFLKGALRESLKNDDLRQRFDEIAGQEALVLRSRDIRQVELVIYYHEHDHVSLSDDVPFRTPLEQPKSFKRVYEPDTVCRSYTIHRTKKRCVQPLVGTRDARGAIFSMMDTAPAWDSPDYMIVKQPRNAKNVLEIHHHSEPIRYPWEGWSDQPL